MGSSDLPGRDHAPWGPSGVRQGSPAEAGSPLHSSVQQVEECLEHHVLHALAGVVQLGCEQGDGSSRGVPHALPRKWGQAPAGSRAEINPPAGITPWGTPHLPEW